MIFKINKYKLKMSFIDCVKWLACGTISKSQFYDFNKWGVIPEGRLIKYFINNRLSINIYEVHTNLEAISFGVIISTSSRIQYSNYYYNHKEFTMLHLALMLGYHSLALEIIKQDPVQSLINKKVGVNRITPYEILFNLDKVNIPIFKYLIDNNIKIDFNIDYDQENIGKSEYLKSNLVSQCMLSPNTYHIYEIHLIEKQKLFEEFYRNNSFGVLSYAIFNNFIEKSILLKIKNIYGESGGTSTALESTLNDILELLSKCSTGYYPEIFRYLLSLIDSFTVSEKDNNILITMLSMNYPESICMHMFNTCMNKDALFDNSDSIVVHYCLYRGYYSLMYNVLNYNKDILTTRYSKIPISNYDMSLGAIVWKDIPITSDIREHPNLAVNFQLFKLMVDLDILRSSYLSTTDMEYTIIYNGFKNITVGDTMQSMQYYLNIYGRTLDKKILMDNVGLIDEVRNTYKELSNIKYRRFYSYVTSLI